MKVMHFGSIANVPYLLCYGLKRTYGIESVIVANVESLNNPFIYSETNNPYRVRFHSLRTKQDSLRLLPEMLTADILHFHSNRSLKQVIFRALPRLGLVRHFHGSDVRTLSADRRELLHAISRVFGEKVLVATFDLLTFWSDAEFMPNPVNPLFFETQALETEYSIYLPTRFENRTKGIQFAFEAWDKIKRIDRDVVLKVVCWGEDLSDYYNVYRGDGRIKWLPVMSQPEMALEMKKSSVIWGEFKLSQMGLMGLTDLESIASGKTLFMKFTRPRSIDYNPPLVNVNTPNELAQKTYQFLSDKNSRIALGRKAQEWCKKYHGLENVTQKLLRIYDSLIWDK